MDILQWLSSSDNMDDLSQDLMSLSMKQCGKSKRIYDQTKFCDPQIQQKILKLKTKLNGINPKEFERARSVCNPYEAVGRSIFQNRSSVKLANLDAITEFMFTDPKYENGDPMKKEYFYFADICGGPGGFSEYIMWRTNRCANGFGFTLRGRNDFRLYVSSENFDRYYGVVGDGNLLNPRNLTSLKEHVLTMTHGKGVHIALADGGFSVENPNLQEVFSQQLITCQFYAVMSVLSDEGSCVIKVFDCFTSFTVGLIFLIYRSFRKLSIVKPKSSRPANSERYIICKNKRSRAGHIEEYLLQIIDKMWNDSQNRILQLVPNELLVNDHIFCKYIVDSNNIIGRSQIDNLTKIFSWMKNSSTAGQNPDHEENKQFCLRDWKLPHNQQIKERANKKLKKDNTSQFCVSNNKMIENNSIDLAMTKDRSDADSIETILTKIVDRKMDDMKNEIKEPVAIESIETILKKLVDQKFLDPCSQMDVSNNKSNEHNFIDLAMTKDRSDADSIETILTKIVDRKMDDRKNEIKEPVAIESIETILKKLVDKKMSELRGREFVCPSPGYCVCCRHWSEHIRAVRGRGRGSYNSGGGRSSIYRGRGGRGYSYY